MDIFKNVIARSETTKQSLLLLQKRDCFSEFTLSKANVLAMTRERDCFSEFTLSKSNVLAATNNIFRGCLTAGRNRQRGFSAAEVLIAVGILGVAMIFIAGVFPVGIRLTQVSIDRTTAAVVANEAFAKVQLYSEKIGPRLDFLRFGWSCDFNDWFDEMEKANLNKYLVDVNTFSWPTDTDVNFPDKRYCWSALLRRTDRFVTDPNIPDSSKDVQVTVFVCRRFGPSVKYYQPDPNSFGTNIYGGITAEVNDLPKPVKVEVSTVSGRANELQITNSEEKTLINDGDVLVDDATGTIYRVQERYKGSPPDDQTILLDKDWPASGIGFVWVVPPVVPMSSQRGLINGVWQVSGKSPCVAVYQKVIRF
jgi:hypothetical protein